MLVQDNEVHYIVDCFLFCDTDANCHLALLYREEGDIR